MRGKILGGRYRIQNKIGEGGMANIYVAYDEKLSRKVAVKFLHRHMSGNQDIRKRFFHEAQAISSLNHPNILKVYDFSGEQSEDVWMVTEILHGSNLSEYAKSFPGNWLHPIIAAMICREILKALDTAHNAGIVHRDVKPENVFVLNSGGIRLMDFGIAKNNRVQSMTMTGTFMGSPSYMSPEQIRGKSVDSRSDLYSLGVLFYEIISNKLPYSGSTTHDIVLKICEGKFKPPIYHVPNLPSDLNKMICKAMAKHPMHRYQEARTFAKDIDIFLARHQFEESHIELERYFKDREKFEARLRKLDFTNKATVPAKFKKNRSSKKQVKSSTTKINHTRMVSNQENADSLRIANQNSLDHPIQKSNMRINRQELASQQNAGPRRDRLINVIPPRVTRPPHYTSSISNQFRQQKKRMRPRLPKRQAPVNFYKKHITYASPTNNRLVNFAGFFLIALFISLSIAGFYFFQQSLSKSKRNTDIKSQPKAKVTKPLKVQKKTHKKPINNKRKPRVKTKKVTTKPRRQPIKDIKKPLDHRPKPNNEIKPPTSKARPVNRQKPAATTTKKPINPPRVANKPAYFRISSQPAAEIYVDGRRVGTTIDKTMSSGWIKVSTGTYKIELRRTGYKTYSRSLKLKPGQKLSAPMITLERSR